MKWRSKAEKEVESKKQVSLWLREDQYQFLENKSSDSISRKAREIFDNQMTGYQARVDAVIEELEMLFLHIQDPEVRMAVITVQKAIMGDDVGSV